MKILKFAAIDIGSNAARLLLTNVVEDGETVVFSKSSLVRVPIRLGEDAFSIGHISEHRAQKLLKTMIAFKNLMEAQDVVAYRACATSAMRSSSNALELVSMVKQHANINIEIIDGSREAEIIYANGIAEMLDHDRPYIYVDVGGKKAAGTWLYRHGVCAGQPVPCQRIGPQGARVPLFTHHWGSFGFSFGFSAEKGARNCGWLGWNML